MEHVNFPRMSNNIIMPSVSIEFITAPIPAALVTLIPVPVPAWSQSEPPLCGIDLAEP